MGVTIGVESAPGQGSTFYFTAAFGRSAEGLPCALPDDLLGRAVLIVGGEPTSRGILGGLLESLGVQPLMATSKSEALALLAAMPADKGVLAVFIDDAGNANWGTKVRAAIRSTTRVLRTPIYAIAPAGLSATPPKGFDGTIGKPFTLGALTRILVGKSEPELPADKAKGAFEPSLAGSEILLVEDDEINQEIAGEMLTGAGAAVSIADSGADALSQLARRSFDVVLMDVHMPGMDGYEVTRRIREDARLADLPVIAMTASAVDDDRKLCLAAGMNGHIAKPIDRASLVAQLREILPRRSPPELGALTEVDRTAAIERLGGSTALYDKLLRMFRDSHWVTGQGLKHIRAIGDTDAVQLAVHTLKGLVATIGAESLANLAARIERTVADRGVDAARRDLDLFERALAAVSADIDQALNPGEPTPRIPARNLTKFQ
jgi:CheY-like chemotaxis protein/HPt (histidine-containing phosphotransfer) domain-containing protein